MTSACYRKKSSVPTGRERHPSSVRIIVDKATNGRAFKPGSRLHSKFFYEIRPILAISKYVQAKKIQFTLLNAQVDGFILTRNRWKAVEMTSAIDHRNEALQDEYMEKFGECPLTTEIEAKGTKRKRIIKEINYQNSCARNVHEYLAGKFMPQIKEVLEKKLQKNNEIYNGAYLGIVFDDYLCPQEFNLKKKRYEPIFQSVLDNIVIDMRPFERLFFIGVSAEYLYDSKNRCSWRAVTA